MSPQLLPSVHIRWSGPYSTASLLANDLSPAPDSGFFQIYQPSPDRHSYTLLYIGLCRGSLSETLRKNFAWLPLRLRDTEVVLGIPEVGGSAGAHAALGRAGMEKARNLLIKLGKPAFNEAQGDSHQETGSFQVFNWGERLCLPEFAIAGEKQRVMALRYC